jgi:integrase/recombinase XerD
MSEQQATITDFAGTDVEVDQSTSQPASRESTGMQTGDRDVSQTTVRHEQRNHSDQYDLPHSLARRWLAARHGTRLCDRTAKNYEAAVRQFISFLHASDRGLLEAELGDFERYIEHRVRNGRAQNTVQHDRTSVKDMYHFINARTDADPAIKPYEFDEIDLNAYNYTGGFEREALSIDEVKLLFEHFDHKRNRLMTYLGVATGLRNSDIRTLRLEHVHYPELQIHVPDPKYGEPYDVPMSRELGRRLKQWENIGRKSYSSHRTSDFMFPSDYGEKLEWNQSFTRTVRRAAERAGIQEVIGRAPNTGVRNLDYEYHRVTVHTLRHTFITLLKKAGVPPEARRLVANHDHIETTKRYEHFNESYDDLIRSLLAF